MKGSEIHRIVAAVLEIMERAQFDIMADAKLIEDKENKCRMDFTKKEATLEELNNVRKQLGSQFSIRILPKDSKVMYVSVIAPCCVFAGLLDDSNAARRMSSIENFHPNRTGNEVIER